MPAPAVLAPPHRSVGATLRAHWLIATLAVLTLAGAGVAAAYLLQPDPPPPACDAEHIAACRTRCDLGEVDSCLQLARWHRYGQGVERDGAVSARLFDKACKGGELEGCEYLGFSYQEGFGVEQSDEKAAELYTRSCDGGLAPACDALAAMVAEGRPGVDKNEPRAVELFGKACDGGEPSACLTLASLYEEGTAVDVDADRAGALREQARTGARDGCEGNNDKLPPSRACIMIATMHAEGRGVERDAREAARLHRRACEEGSAQSCHAAANLYLVAPPLGAEDNPSLAEELLVRGCEEPDRSLLARAQCCVALAELRMRQSSVPGGPPPPPELTAPLLERSLGWLQTVCDYGGLVGERAGSCMSLATAYRAAQYGAPKDDDKAGSLYGNACKQGVAEGCEQAAAVAAGAPGSKPSPAAEELAKRALDLFERRCIAALPLMVRAGGCAALARAHQLGDGRPKDEKRALELHDLACRGGRTDACLAGAELAKRGPGPDQDKKVASFLRHACERQHPRACFELGVALTLDANARDERQSAFREGIAIAEKLCDSELLHPRGRVEACHMLGGAHAGGLGIDKNVAEAFKRYHQACEMGSIESCGAAVALHAAEKAGDQAAIKAVATATEKMCSGTATMAGVEAQLIRGHACSLLATLHLAGIGVTRDPGLAWTLHKQACDAVPPACANAAMRYMQKEPKRSVELVRAGCDKEDLASCSLYGAHLLQGLGVERDVPAAVAIYERGCKASSAMDCYRLAVLHHQGLGVGRDLKKAVEHFVKACQLGVAESCAAALELRGRGQGPGIDDATAKDMAQRAIASFDARCQQGEKESCQNLRAVKQRGW